MRFERIFKLKISADSLALPKEILSQKGTKDHRLKNRFLDDDGYKSNPSIGEDDEFYQV